MTFTPSFFLSLIEATNPPRSNPTPTIAGNAIASLPPFTTGLGFTGFFFPPLLTGFFIGFTGLEPPFLFCGFVGRLLSFGLGLSFCLTLEVIVVGLPLITFIIGLVLNCSGTLLALGFAFVGLEPPFLVCGFVGNLLGFGLGFTLPVIFFLFAGFTNLGFVLVCGFLGKTDFTIFLAALTTALSLLVVFFAILIASLTALAPYFATALALFAAIALAITVNATLPPIANISGIAMLTSPHFSVWHTSKRPVL